MTKIERWKPEEGDLYFFVSTTGGVFPDRADDDFASFNGRFGFGNYFRSRSEAQAAAEKVKALLLNLPDNDNNPVSNLPDNDNNLANNSPDKKLPDWCKVGEWIYYEDNLIGDTYAKVKEVTDKYVMLAGDMGDVQLALEDVQYAAQARSRPYNADELRGLVGKVIKTPKDIAMVLGYSGERNKVCVATTDNYFTAETLLAVGAKLNGKPAGVLEHLNDNEEWVK